MLVDLSNEPDDAGPPDTNLHIGPYSLSREYLEDCLRPGVWLHDEAISAFVWIVCERKADLFVDSQRVALWVKNGPSGSAPPGVRDAAIPWFLIVNDVNTHWYVIHLNSHFRLATAHGTSSVATPLRRRLQAWLGKEWMPIRTVGTLLTGDAEEDAALQTTECGVAVCRAVADLMSGMLPRAPFPEDRELIRWTIVHGADLR